MQGQSQGLGLPGGRSVVRSSPEGLLEEVGWEPSSGGGPGLGRDPIVSLRLLSGESVYALRLEFSLSSSASSD